MEIPGMESLILTFLTMGFGYIILLASFYRTSRTDYFYRYLRDFDKLMQSLIIGFAAMLLSIYSLKIQLSLDMILPNILYIMSVEIFFSIILVSIISDNIEKIMASERRD